MSSKDQFYHAYSENFKGAPDGWHKLKKVNFLIGENSTGKSSFQQLFRIVSSSSFTFSFDPLNVIPSISSAADIVGRISDGVGVTIGFAASPGREADTPSEFFGRIITYLDIDGELSIAGITFASKECVFTIIRDKNSKLRYFHFDEIHVGDLITNPDILSKIHIESLYSETGIEIEFEEMSFQPDDWRVAAVVVAGKIINSPSFNPIVAPQIFRAYSYGPSRRAPQRLLHGGQSRFNSFGEHAPFVLKDVVQYIPELQDKLSSYGVASGLFDFISIEEVKTKVADRPFIITLGKSGKHFYIDELGYGVSQILPVVIDSLVAGPEQTLFIQQPELHLHPRAQAEFGSLIHKNSHQAPDLVIETHSDFIIDRFRVEQALAEDDKKVDAQVLFFSIDKLSGRNVLKTMTIEADGSFSEVPDEYREFFIDENMKILEAL